eukprot:CAMPEP_0172420482 /NCGR_PEP_ID=MMETSP1064-20121228/6839_1 /TAXON_ID=202472 /ORGANISM="Aulacoseira subarctica , Strain CCAP 1002/5" /LENGTH=490 /DNA_ID=CAMNT_0013160465 /DNA_START=64 /DNA_END=1536 /DNA_ORIENTATION=+
MRGAIQSCVTKLAAGAVIVLILSPPVIKASSVTKSSSSNTLKPSFLDKVLNDVQIWAIRHPRNVLSMLLLPPISVVEGLLANNPTYLDRKRLMFGNNFCCAGEVVLGDFATVESALISPQARTYRLGQSVLNHKNLMVNGRDLFLLALSDPQITEGKDVNANMHVTIRKAVLDLIINDAALRRQRDSTAKRLLKEVAQDYQNMDHSTGGKFFTATDSGLKRFVIRYMHYVLFGLDPDDKVTMDFMTKLHFEMNGVAYFLSTIGKILQLFNIGGAKQWPSMWKKASNIYKSSPSLRNVSDSQMIEYGISLDEFTTILQPLIGIAAIPGPLGLANVALGAEKFPAYEGHQTSTIDQVACWDEIKDLNDRLALEKHIYECGRLWTPVSACHRVATTDFVTEMNGGGRNITFPQGSTILIPMSLGMLSEEIWGPTAYEYDAERKNLCPFSMIFNSVGDRSNGRICPGKDLSVNLVVELLQELGSVRRRGTLATS